MRRLLHTARVEGLIEGATGLTTAQASERRARYGTNRIVESPPSGWTDLLRETARDPMLWFLVATALLFAGLGEYAEAGVLAFALLPIAGMDAYLYRRMQASTEGLAGRLATTTAVVRDGVHRDIASVDVVPGDLIVVPEGSTIPADGLVVAGEGLQADESALTGEAMPVRKAPFHGPLGGAEELAVDGLRWGFAGTRVLTGRNERTPLQRAIGTLVKALVAVAVVICVALAATRLAQGHGFIDATLSAVTLAVAALPEEFPVVFAFFLGVGIYRLARRQALVRRAVAVENIGRVTCICSDKTGTLTEGQLRLAHVVAASGIEREKLLAAAATASRAGSGDPLDVAIAQSAERVPGETLATFPFTEERRRETAVIQTIAGAALAAAKGAPETICAMARLTVEERARWLARAQALAATGHKVIACCEHTFAPDAWPGGEPDRDYTFLGVLAFEDPVREGVAAAVANAQGAGIRVIMVTGDHPATARAVAVELGLGAGAPHVIEGDELDPLLERDGTDGLRGVDVIARAVPAQKLDLVKALQRAGEIVAVTGDGVNDVPALQGADIGIAMGERGTRTAREVASIVLLDDNFRTIVSAIAEGRQLFRNLKLSFAYLLMVHIPLVLTAALVPFAGFPLLYLPAHIVWLELIIHPTAVLAFQQAAPHAALAIADGRAAARFFDRREWLVIGAVGALITVALIAGYARSLGSTQDVEHARSTALAILAVASATVTVGLSGMRGRVAWTLSIATIASAVVILQIESLAHLLHLSVLHTDDWLVAAGIGLAAGWLSTLQTGLRRPIPRAATRTAQG